MFFAENGPKKDSRYAIFREKCFAIIGTSCALCGSTKNLSIDHKDWRNKTFEIATHSAKKFWNQVVDELQKCQALCEVCHKKKSAQDLSERHSRPIIHGTLTGYSHHKCRCDACKAVKKKHARDWKIWTGRLRDLRPRNVRALCGSYSKYKAGCRCTACTQAKEDYQKDYYARNKEWVKAKRREYYKRSKEQA